jgi:hypothetical protein
MQTSEIPLKTFGFIKERYANRKFKSCHIWWVLLEKCGIKLIIHIPNNMRESYVEIGEICYQIHTYFNIKEVEWQSTDFQQWGKIVEWQTFSR